MKLTISRVIVASAICFVILPVVMLANDCLDEAMETEATAGVAIAPETEVSQTITCQLGGRIASLEMRVAVVGALSGPLVVSVYSTRAVSGSIVPHEPLAEWFVYLADLGAPQDVALDISDADIWVTPGQTLAVAMHTTESPWIYVEWLGDSSSAYAGGKAHFRAFDPDWLEILDENGQDVDLGLKVSLECATPVEHHSWSSVKALYR